MSVPNDDGPKRGLGGARPIGEAVQPPEVSYARSGEVAVAYQVVGTGVPDLVFARGIAGDLLSSWEQPLIVGMVWISRPIAGY